MRSFAQNFDIPKVSGVQRAQVCTSNLLRKTFLYQIEWYQVQTLDLAQKFQMAKAYREVSSLYHKNMNIYQDILSTIIEKRNLSGNDIFLQTPF